MSYAETLYLGFIVSDWPKCVFNFSINRMTVLNNDLCHFKALNTICLLLSGVAYAETFCRCFIYIEVKAQSGITEGLSTLYDNIDQNAFVNFEGFKHNRMTSYDN